LPATLDPRIRELARRWASGASSDLAIARSIETSLRTGYGYTLELPPASADPLTIFCSSAAAATANTSLRP
jgi:hypothetical protein